MTAGQADHRQHAALAARVLSRTAELACIPAPTGAEHARASLVRRWWDEDGWAPSAGNTGDVWAQVPGGPDRG